MVRFMLFQQSVNKIKIIKMCIYLIVLALIFKVGYIQIIDRKNIYDKALESWQRSFPVQANRGKIYDRSENVLATDLTTASLVVVPSQIKDQATTALELSKILNLDVNVLKEKLNKKVSIQRISPSTFHRVRQQPQPMLCAAPSPFLFPNPEFLRWWVHHLQDPMNISSSAARQSARGN